MHADAMQGKLRMISALRRGCCSRSIEYWLMAKSVQNFACTTLLGKTGTPNFHVANRSIDFQGRALFYMYP